MRLILFQHYCPVAVTLHWATKLTLLLAGKVAIVSPVVKKLVALIAIGVPRGSKLLGQEAAGVPVVATQAMVVQLKPGVKVSLTIAPLDRKSVV